MGGGTESGGGWGGGEGEKGGGGGGGGGEVCIQKCAGKPEGMRTFGRPMPRWEGNIQMDLKGTG